MALILQKQVKVNRRTGQNKGFVNRELEKISNLGQSRLSINTCIKGYRAVVYPTILFHFSIFQNQYYIVSVSYESCEVKTRRKIGISILMTENPHNVEEKICRPSVKDQIVKPSAL